jgi:xanthine dehydrogenase YagR molybdenum-binding subunit
METMKYSMASYGAHFCEVRVNEESGEVRVSRWLGSFDCGTVINPKTAMSQLRGGIIMGIGMALTEETMFDDRTGRIMNPSLANITSPCKPMFPISTSYTPMLQTHTRHSARTVWGRSESQASRRRSQTLSTTPQASGSRAFR